MSTATSIKKIPVDGLRPGMFVHDVNCSWLDHPFVSSRFPVKDQGRVEEIRALGVREIYIDTSQGLDLADAQTVDEVRQQVNAQMIRIVSDPIDAPSAVPLASEIERARRLYGDACRVVRKLTQEIRLGRPIGREQVEPVVARVVESIFRNPDALLPLLRLKDRDNYTFQHCVSVCALLVSFGRWLKLERSIIKEMGIGGLLHDVGKTGVPDAILNKPATLTEAEFADMKSHVVQGIVILQNTPGISQIALDVTAQHHERFDGSGYPNQRRGDEISLYGRMGSIVDVYDAITSDRVYRKAISPTAALGRLLEWSSYNFDPGLVRAFIKCVGIYPTGSLVRMESGRLAVVLEQNAENMLKPRVNAIYHSVQHCYLKPEIVDLSRSNCQDRIVGHEDDADWGIDPKRWLSG